MAMELRLAKQAGPPCGSHCQLLPYGASRVGFALGGAASAPAGTTWEAGTETGAAAPEADATWSGEAPGPGGAGTHSASKTNATARAALTAAKGQRIRRVFFIVVL